MNLFSSSSHFAISPRVVALSSLSLTLAFSGLVAAPARAQATLPSLPPAPAPNAPAAPVPNTPVVTVPAAPQSATPTATQSATATLDRAAVVAAADPDALSINIDGRNVISDPPPLLRDGRTFVPLRGVLENLGAKVDYIAAERRVNIARGAQNVQLFLGTTRAVLDGREVEVEKPLLINGRAFVPLRAVSELFGLKVSWLAPTRTVAIYTGAPVAKPIDARAELKATGPFGLTIDFTQQPVEQIPSLLDSAKASGVGLVKFRFDWGTLEPTKDAAFEWAYFDTIVRETRARGLGIVGILGDTAPWASVSSSTFGGDQRQSPPRPDAYNSWANYVRRTVGRYGNDVLAWQVWESPNSVNFRSVDKNYRKLARLAIDEARKEKPNILIYVAEPGGVDLDTIRGYNSNGLTQVADGIEIYPTSLYQALAPASPEAFLRPYARVKTALNLNDGKTRDYWVGGISRPVALPYPNVKPSDDGQRALELFTPLAQADYLVKSMVLGIAAGSDKVFYEELRDVPDARMNAALQANPPLDTATAPAVIIQQGSPAVVATAPTSDTAAAPANASAPATTTAPVSTENAPATSAVAAPNGQTTVAATMERVSAPRDGVVQDSGLQRADGTPRPAFAALSNLVANLKDKPYRGNLSFNSDLVALLFNNAQGGVVVAWSPKGEATLALNSSGAEVDLPGAQFVSTRPQSLVTDATGNVVAPPDSVLKIGTRPVIITGVALQTIEKVAKRAPSEALLLQDPMPYASVNAVSAQLSPDGTEDGIYWRKYADFGSVAQTFVTREGRAALTTQPQSNIFDLKSQKPFIYLDVADDFIYDAPGVPVTLGVEVYAPPLNNPNLPLGFRVEYNSSSGNRSVPWQPLVPGSGWQTFQIPLPDAQFANAGGYDILFNVGASATGVSFGNVSVTRGAAQAPAATTGLSSTP